MTERVRLERAALLRRVAAARACLLLPRLPGAACVLVGVEDARVSPPGASRWAVRGALGRIGPTWADGFAFAGAVRAPDGLLGLKAGLGSPRCGLCALEPPGGLDEWVAGHILGVGVDG